MTAISRHAKGFPGRIPQHVGTEDAAGKVSGFQRLGFTILVFYLFLIYSRVFEVAFSFLHVPGISYRVILVMVILTLAFVRALKSDIGKALLAFTVWLIAAIPGSMWIGGSVKLLLDGWLPAFVIFLATAGMIVNYDQCRKAVHTVAYGLLVLTVIAMIWGSTEGTGRLFLPYGKFANPNEMAQALLLGLCLWLLMYLNAKSIVARAFAAAVIVVMLFVVSKTGSRGALIAFGILILFVFLRSTLAGKMKMVVGGAVLLAIIVSVMPKSLLNRYRTLTEDREDLVLKSDDQLRSKEDQFFESSAYDSAATRKELLVKSIKYTFLHPLFGVGPGMFEVAEDKDAIAAGRRHGRWQGTHNSYTQVSSECGIPALVFYILVIVFALKRTYYVRRKTRGDPRLQDISNIALCLNYSLIVFAATAFFDYIAYTSMLSVFSGLSAALAATYEAEIEKRNGAATKICPAPAPAPSPAASFPGGEGTAVLA